MTTAYRIHPATEATDTVLDVNRPIGWTMDGEESPGGVACMAELGFGYCGLARYMADYGMSVKADDILMRIKGYQTAEGHDGCDIFVAATSYEVLATGAEFLAAVKIAKNEDWDADAGANIIALAREIWAA
jgi:hypothetical protein